MAKSSTPTLGKYRLRNYALSFGAPLDDQRIEAIADPFDRERAMAFIEYKRAAIATWHKFALADFGAPFGTAEQREKADEYLRAENARAESWHRRENQFPALVRAKGFEELLDPFDADDDSETPVEFGSRLDDPAPATLLPEWSAATVWIRFVTMNEWRLKYVCLYNGSASETVEGVPAENRADFEEHVEYLNQDRQKLFEEACNEHGGRCFFEDIPAAQKPAALYDLESRIARFADNCKFELEILRIEEREKASELVAEFG